MWYLSALKEQLVHNHILRILEVVADQIPAKKSTSLAEDVFSRLRNFKAPPTLVQAFVQTLSQVEIIRL
jgi:hypothetical protein